MSEAPGHPPATLVRSMILYMSPKRQKLLPENLHDELLSYIIDSNFPTELHEISSQTIITGLSDVEFSSVKREESLTRVEGTATVKVQSNYGGGASRDGVTSGDSYPMKFVLLVDEPSKIESGTVSVDTSSFYE